MTPFTGLQPETDAEREVRLAAQMPLPVCAGTVKETLYDTPPKWYPVEMQAATNTCAVNAGTSCAEVIEFMATGRYVQRSRNWLYLMAAKYCQYKADNGRTLGAVIKAATVDGICTEARYPFKGFYDSHAPAGCAEEAAQFKLVGTIDVRSGYDAVRTVLGQNLGSVLMASYWPYKVWGNYQVQSYVPTGSGGHAQAFLFLSSRTDSRGRPWVWCAGSHSTDEFKGGFSEWSPDAVDELLHGYTWGITGLTDMTVPKPREARWAGADNPFAK